MAKRKNQSRYILLGLLDMRPMSGYDIKKILEISFYDIWSESYGNIYPTLKTFLHDGLAKKQRERQEGKPDRKVYRITDKGWDMLYAELANPAPSHKVRSEFLAQMAFAHLMTPEQVQTVLDSRIADADRNLEFIDEFENSCDCDWPAGVRFTLDFGRAMLQAMKTYVEENRHMFDDSKTTTKKVAAR